MNPLHRIDAEIFRLPEITEDELYEKAMRLYKERGVISTKMITSNFPVGFDLALKVMSRIIICDSPRIQSHD